MYYLTELIAEFSCVLRSGQGTRVPRALSNFHDTEAVTLCTLAFLDGFLVMFRRCMQALWVAYIVHITAGLGFSFTSNENRLIA